jgi:hypothetical protein
MDNPLNKVMDKINSRLRKNSAKHFFTMLAHCAIMHRGLELILTMVGLYHIIPSYHLESSHLAMDHYLSIMAAPQKLPLYYLLQACQCPEIRNL